MFFQHCFRRCRNWERKITTRQTYHLTINRYWLKTANSYNPHC
jgi:hypothetical protein